MPKVSKKLAIADLQGKSLPLRLPPPSSPLLFSSFSCLLDFRPHSHFKATIGNELYEILSRMVRLTSVKPASFSTVMCA
ncbi:hypothetical protein ACS0TY_025604 [Phlomoides rotata]